MLKFLRKYNKFILVIGGVLLMIAFLLPQGIQQLASRTGDKKAATLNGRTLKLSDFGLAEREVNVLERIAVLRVPTPQGLRGVSLITSFVDQRVKDEHWILLTEAAQEAGFIGGPEHGQGYIDELAQTQVILGYQAMLSQQIPNPALVQAIAQQQFESEEGQQQYRDVRNQYLRLRSDIAAQARMLPEEVDQALAKLRGVQRMTQAFNESIRTSSIEAERVASYYTDRVTADVLALRADDLVDASLEPTEEQLQAHFEKYRTLIPGQEGLGFGYMMPPRVKLQWLMLDRQAISDAVSIPVLEVAKAHQANRTAYPGELEAERARIENDLKKQRVDELIALAEATIRGEISRVLRPLEVDGDFKKLPADWTPPDLFAVADTVAAAVKSKEQVDFPTPRIVRQDAQWNSASDLQALDGIGTAFLRTGNAENPLISLPQVVFSTREINPDSPLGLQVGVPYLTNKLEDFAGNRYLLLVTDAAPAGEPTAISDLMNPQIVRDDWRKEQAYQFLLAQQETLKALAIEDGFQSVIDAFFPPTDTQSARPTVQRGVEFAVSQTVVNGQVAPFDSEAVRDAVRSVGSAFDPLTPVDQVPVADRTLTVAADQARSLLIVRVVGLAPLTIESFRQVRDAAVNRGLQDDLAESDITLSPFSFESLRQRMDYTVREAVASTLRSGSLENAGNSAAGSGTSAQPESEPQTQPAG